MGNVVGIVAEYNPFHNGHFYHLQKAKEKAGASNCICVISGNFTQRGEPSIVNKWMKAYMALCGGANLVIELPVEYSISSAENFASGAVKILSNLGIVDDISFGAECEDLATLNNIANVIYNEPQEYKNILSHELSKGISYPAAREKAIMMYLNDIKRYANVLANSNNILAIEYLKAIKMQKSQLNPVLIKREKVYYNDMRIVDDLASATAIRKMMEQKEYSQIRKVVPKSTYKILGEEFKKENIILGLKQYEKEIIYKLRMMNVGEIANLPDVSEGLEYSIKKASDNCNNLEKLINSIKSKRYTQTRIQRILIYALLGISKTDIEISRKIIPYARVLGFDEKGKMMLSEIVKSNPKLKVITSVNKFMQIKPKKREEKLQLEMLRKDILATDIYTLGYKDESKGNLDFTHNMIIIN